MQTAVNSQPDNGNSAFAKAPLQTEDVTRQFTEVTLTENHPKCHGRQNEARLDTDK